MFRLAPAAIVLLLVGVAAYSGSFYATRSVFAHYTHCDSSSPWTTVPCNADNSPPQLPRYWAIQIGDENQLGYSDGIEGFVSAQDVAIHDQDLRPGDRRDFIVQLLRMQGGSQGAELVQAGFVEGKLPNGQWRGSPKVFTENIGSCFGYTFSEYATPSPNPRYDEWFRVSWAGATGYGCGGTIYIWQYGRGSSFGTFQYGFMFGSPFNRYDAGTEHLDRNHMEPNGTQCFGGGYLCSSWTYGYDLFLWRRSAGYWQLWDYTRPTVRIEDEAVENWRSGYFHNDVTNWYEFTTTGNWR